MTDLTKKKMAFGDRESRKVFRHTIQLFKSAVLFKKIGIEVILIEISFKYG